MEAQVKKIRYQINVDVDLWEKVTVRAKRTRTPISFVIRRCLEEFATGNLRLSLFEDLPAENETPLRR